MAILYDPSSGLYIDTITGGTSPHYQTSIPVDPSSPFAGLTSGGDSSPYARSSLLASSLARTFAPITYAIHSFSPDTFGKSTFGATAVVVPTFDQTPYKTEKKERG